ncbi:MULTISPECIES: hypothetical protein [Pelosinus]|uniref:Uncharacterized protein n=2 Tax=Pelosinus TaxID=365348 RepID=I9NUI2_9FIRM|nr:MULTISPECIES: hypothetical protein [Pelosinus]AJQ29994.1 hypothetical protein JBW_04665 [Pelosinus fermentans JBW45]MCC5465341.1 hypothetical protein [Pelosinus baikalensis]
MRPLCKILMLLAVPARLMKSLYSRDISVRHSIEVKSDEAVNTFQVSQVYNDAIEDMRIETTILDS